MRLTTLSSSRGRLRTSRVSPRLRHLRLLSSPLRRDLEGTSFNVPFACDCYKSVVVYPITKSTSVTNTIIKSTKVVTEPKNKIMCVLDRAWFIESRGRFQSSVGLPFDNGPNAAEQFSVYNSNTFGFKNRALIHTRTTLTHIERPPFFSLDSLSRTERQLRALPAARSRTSRTRRWRDLWDSFASKRTDSLSPTLFPQPLLSRVRSSTFPLPSHSL